jgi:hypothetical protein
MFLSAIPNHNVFSLNGLDSVACSYSELNSESYTQTVGLLERGINPSQARYMLVHRTTQTELTQTSMPRVEFELTIPLIERAKIFHALDLLIHFIFITIQYVPLPEMLK